MKIKIKTRNLFCLIVLITIIPIENIFSQDSLYNAKVTVIGDVAVNLYLYKGDKILVNALPENTKQIKSFKFCFVNADNIDEVTVLEETPKPVSISKQYSVEKTGAYSFTFKSKNYSTPYALFNLAITRIEGGKEGIGKPFNVLEQKSKLYYPDLSVREGKSILIPITKEDLAEHWSNELKKSVALLKSMGIDYSKVDVILPNKIALNSILIVDTNFISNSTNKLMGTIYANPFFTSYYFRACAGDTIIINVNLGKSVAINIFNFNNSLSIRKFENVANVQDFTFIAGDDFIYQLEFENLNLKDVQAALKITKLTKKDASCIKPIHYTFIETTITAENGINSAKHRKIVPIRD